MRTRVQNLQSFDFILVRFNELTKPFHQLAGSVIGSIRETRVQQHVLGDFVTLAKPLMAYFTELSRSFNAVNFAPFRRNEDTSSCKVA